MSRHRWVWGTAAVVVLAVLGLLFVPSQTRTPRTKPSQPAPLGNPLPQEEAHAGAQPLKGWTIVLDPGHGGDTGTPARFPGAQPEEVSVWDIAWKLKGLLERDGARVILTRDADHTAKYKGLGQLPSRTQLANDNRADLFVSIHQNESPTKNPQEVGVKTYYYSKDRRTVELAREIEREVVQGTGLKDAGVPMLPFYVLRNTNMPAVLIEGGFLSNRAEAVQIADDGFHQRQADAIERAILTYAKRYPKAP